MNNYEAVYPQDLLGKWKLMAGKPTRLKDICFDSLVFVKLNLLTEILGDTKLSDSFCV